MPVRQFQPMYVDMTRHNALGAVMRWCDTFGATYMDDLDISADQIKDLKKSMAFQYVNRMTRIQMLVRGQGWEEALLDSSGLSVSQCISKMGRTSCSVYSCGSTSTGSELFLFSTVMVHVDAEDPTKTLPIRYPEAHRAAVREVQAPEAPSATPRPASAFVWSARVRHTDCDLIGHLNNAVYGNLMEDARRAAVAAGAFRGVKAASGDVRLASVEYLGQPKAGQDLGVAVWWDEGAELLGFEFVLEGREVVARCAVVPWADEPASRL